LLTKPIWRYPGLTSFLMLESSKKYQLQGIDDENGVALYLE
jgi:hypothetical protein